METIINGRLAVYASAARAGKAIEMYGACTGTEKSMALSSDMTGISGARLDFDYWLPQAAEQYCISKDVKDYILVPVPTIISDVPNTNGVAFPREELAKFQPEYGCMAYKTFKGKPTFYEHANQDVTKAKGVIADVFLTPLRGYGKNLVKVVELLAFDRSKDPMMCDRIISGDLNSYSMGAYFEGYHCSSCGAEKMKCNHTSPKDGLKKTMDGTTLVYRNLYNVCGFETSAVESPAYISALSDIVMAMDGSI